MSKLTKCQTCANPGCCADRRAHRKFGFAQGTTSSFNAQHKAHERREDLERFSSNVTLIRTDFRLVAFPERRFRWRRWRWCPTRRRGWCGWGRSKYAGHGKTRDSEGPSMRVCWFVMIWGVWRCSAYLIIFVRFVRVAGVSPAFVSDYVRACHKVSSMLIMSCSKEPAWHL